MSKKKVPEKTFFIDSVTGRKFNILAIIAINGNSKVFKLSSETGEIFAAKTRKIELVGCFVLRREYDIYQEIQTDPVAELLIPTLPKSPYFVDGAIEVLLMEFVPFTLHGLLASFHGTEVEINTLATNLLRCLKYFHRATGMVHCDVKPHNFLLRDDDPTTQPLLIDFQISEKFGKFSFGQTKVWASINQNIKCSTLGIVDDLESLGYIISAFMMCPKKLPWLEMKIVKKEIVPAKRLFMKNLKNESGSKMGRFFEILDEHQTPNRIIPIDPIYKKLFELFKLGPVSTKSKLV